MIVKKQAIFNLGTSGELVAAVEGKKIRVLGFFFVCTGAVTVVFKSATTALTGVMSFGANAVASAQAGRNESEPFLFETVAGEALNVTLGGSVQVSGTINYILL